MDRIPASRAYLGSGQVATMLGVSAKTVNRWANLGHVPCAFTLGGHRRFRADVIAALASSLGLGGDKEPDYPL